MHGTDRILVEDPQVPPGNVDPLWLEGGNCRSATATGGVWLAGIGILCAFSASVCTVTAIDLGDYAGLCSVSPRRTAGQMYDSIRSETGQADTGTSPVIVNR